MTTKVQKRAIAKYLKTEKGQAAVARTQERRNDRLHKTKRVDGVWVIRESHKGVQEHENA